MEVFMVLSEFFIFYTLVPPLTVFFRAELRGFLSQVLPSSGGIYWSPLKHPETDAFCLVVRCFCSITCRAEGIVKCGSCFTWGQESGCARAHWRLARMSCSPVTGSKWEEQSSSRWGAHPWPHKHKFWVVWRGLWAFRVHNNRTWWFHWVSSWIWYSGATEMRWFSIILREKLSDAGYDLLSVQLFSWKIYTKNFFFKKYFVKHKEKNRMLWRHKIYIFFQGLYYESLDLYPNNLIYTHFLFTFVYI